MGVVANRRSIMILYSDAICPNSHRVRIVLAEKGVAVDILTVDPSHPPEDLIDLNPYSSLPTLVDRDLVLYEPNVIMEYLDERFPHPPLMPVYPVARAEFRLLIHRINTDWFTMMYKILRGNESEVAKARRQLTESIVNALPIFNNKAFFMSDDFTLVDCSLAPLFWRLPMMEIEIPEKAKAIHDYAKRLFDRESFQASLSDVERELRGEHV